MKVSGANIEDCKERGEWAELRFMARASEHGLHVCKPWGDSRRYDLAVEHEGKFLRVQVKSTTCKRGNSYVCSLRNHHTQPYSGAQIDFVAAYIIPKNIWFIFPVAVVLNCNRTLVLSPHLNISKYGAYEEAWHLMRGEPLQEKEEERKPDGAKAPSQFLLKAEG
jgi:hypothetical protein